MRRGLAATRLGRLFASRAKDDAMKTRPATLPARAALPVQARGVDRPVAEMPTTGDTAEASKLHTCTLARFQCAAIRGTRMAGS